MRKSYSFIPEHDFTNKALQFADREDHVIYLNPNSYSYPYGGFKHVLAFGSYKKLEALHENNFNALKEFLTIHNDWTFGYFSYDLKNELEKLKSKNPDSIQFPLISFFTPKHLIFFKENNVEIHSIENPEELFRLIQKEEITERPSLLGKITIEEKISKINYIEKIKKIQQSILRGDIYETNFCTEYSSKDAYINPLSTYKKLNDISPMPFSAYMKIGTNYLLCASPERFLKKENKKLISQPIKGTAKREANRDKDNLIKTELATNQKERSENIMIVDLVRNDLSQTAENGSVKVEELCKIYTFPLVHQMISTVVSNLDEKYHSVDAIEKAFPMGSMTGAPKVRAMELIDEFEESSRGLFSGSVGYFTPEMDFDFNVVIRSILYNAEATTLSFQAGSAITYYADAEKEYEECKIKTEAIRQVLK